VESLDLAPAPQPPLVLARGGDAEAGAGFAPQIGDGRRAVVGEDTFDHDTALADQDGAVENSGCHVPLRRCSGPQMPA
jgi:hypothetical protein